MEDIIYIKPNAVRVERESELYIRVKEQFYKSSRTHLKKDRFAIHAITENPIWAQMELRPPAPSNLFIDVPIEGEPVFLHWDIIGGVSEYIIYYRVQGEVEFTRLTEDIITDSPYELVELGTGDYDLYMIAVKDGLISSFSEVISFSIFIGALLKITSDDFNINSSVDSNSELFEVSSNDFNITSNEDSNSELFEVTSDDFNISSNETLE